MITQIILSEMSWVKENIRVVRSYRWTKLLIFEVFSQVLEHTVKQHSLAKNFDEGSLFHLFFKFCLLFRSYVFVVSHCYFRKTSYLGKSDNGKSIIALKYDQMLHPPHYKSEIFVPLSLYQITDAPQKFNLYAVYDNGCKYSFICSILYFIKSVCLTKICGMPAFFNLLRFQSFVLHVTW